MKILPILPSILYLPYKRTSSLIVTHILPLKTNPKREMN